ncbi:MAG: hypothetical protein NVS2B7_10270 [Herpetosiphon sp.]
MHTNIYTAEQYAKAQYGAELMRAEQHRLVRQANDHGRPDPAGDTGSSPRWRTRVLALVMRGWNSIHGVSATPVH